jgi:hypothetical protein
VQTFWGFALADFKLGIWEITVVTANEKEQTLLGVFERLTSLFHEHR